MDSAHPESAAATTGLLNRGIEFALRHRVAVALLALVVAALGAWTTARLEVDVLPDVTRPTITVLTEAHGMVPVEIEQQITRYVERAVLGVRGVQRVRSESIAGLSVVVLEFDEGSDPYRNRQIIQERLAPLGDSLPAGAMPVMAPMASLLGQIQILGLRSKSGQTNPTEIRDLADQVVRIRLESVPGVAQVLSIGGAPKQMQVQVDADRLAATGITLAQVAEAIRRADGVGSGGVLTGGALGPAITLMGRVRSAKDLLDAPILAVGNDTTRQWTIGDVGRVEFGPAALRTGDAGINGGPGALLTVTKQPGVDTMALSERLAAEVEALRIALPEDVEVLPLLYRQAGFIERAIENVTDAVFDGAILVILVLALFLWNLRTTLITLVAIPLSLAITALVFAGAGLSINTMTLGGLAVAIGALVDDAIVDVENVFRRLRENRQREHPRSSFQVVLSASIEVRRPILIGTLVVTSVYLPLFALSGLEGRLFTPIGIAYIVSILASLLVALTVTPVLCYWLLPQSNAVARTESALAVRWLHRAATGIIQTSLRAPIAITTTVLGLALLSIALVWTRGTEFLPPFNEGTAQANLILPVGVSLEESNRYGRALEEVVLSVDGVATVARRTGRAEGDAHVEGINSTEMVVEFDHENARPRAAILGEIRDRLEDRFPGVMTETEQPIAHMLSHLLAGVSSQVAIQIEGRELGALESIANQVKAMVEDVSGTADVRQDPIELVRQIGIRPSRNALRRTGVDVAAIGELVELALEGETIAWLLDDEFRYPIRLRLEADDRGDIESLRALLVSGPDGTPYRLADVAEVGWTFTPNLVSRQAGQRRVVVQHNVEGRALGDVVGDVDRALEPIRAALPPGYSIRIRGQYEAQQRASRTITWLAILALVGVTLLIYFHFGSAQLALQTLASLPAALIGAVAFLVGTDQNLSIATLVGLISLGGIATRNKILLLDHYVHLLRAGVPFGQELILQAGRDRIVPVLMTALTSGIALVPIVLAPEQPGRELLYPIASVIVGGLITTTLADLLLTPATFWLFGRRAAERIAQTQSA